MKKKFKDIFMYLFGSIVVIGTFVIIGLLIQQEIPDNNKEVVYMAIGQSIAAFIMVVAYFYGSSKDHSDNNQKEK